MHRAWLALGGLAVEMLIALAWWWRPEHAVIWASLAAIIFGFAALIDHAARRS